MRILHVTAGNLFGGIERMLLAVAAHARPDCRHDVALCFDGRLGRELRALGAEPIVLGAARFRRPDSVWRARRLLAAAISASGYDAVIAHAPWSTVLASPVARRARVPLVTWVHDAPNPAEWPERRVARTPPDRFICNSVYTASLVARWLPSIPREVIYPPVAPPPPLGADERRAIRAEFRAGDRTTAVLLAARMEEWKGHRVLIEAASQLRGDAAIWIAGGPQRAGESVYLERLKTLAADPSSAARVHFLGNRADVPRIMGAADVYCQPNTQPEPFGVAIIEALAAGLPVVTAAAGGAQEIVDDRCGLRVSESTAPAVARALQRLVDNPELRQSLGSAGRAQAVRISHPAARLKQVEDLVRSIRVGTSAA